MDEQVKARLIGATVLVVIAVILVPELLSGPRRARAPEAESAEPRGTRTITIDLGTGTATEATPAAPAPAPEPRIADASPGTAAQESYGALDAVEPEAGTPQAGESRPSPAPVSQPPAEAVAAAPTAPQTKPAAAAGNPAAPAATAPPPPAASGKGGWSVQVGAFSSAATSRKLVADLGKDGMKAYVAPLERNGKTLHRVRVGPVPTEAEARALAGKLKARGLPGSVVAAD